MAEADVLTKGDAWHTLIILHFFVMRVTMHHVNTILLGPVIAVTLSGCFITDWWNELSDRPDRLPTAQLTVLVKEEEVEEPTKIPLLVEIADDEDERRRGLMERKSLGKRQGMWFIFENEAIRYFWMWNMEIPLDIFYINKDFEVRGILENVQPCASEDAIRCPSYPSSEPVQYVLEVQAGFAEERGVKIGDKVMF